MPVVRDPAALRAILSTDPAWSVYALGDLAPRMFALCSWYAAPAAPALALIYRGSTPPVLFTLGAPAGVATLLDEFAGDPAFYLQVRPEMLPVLSTRYRVTRLKKMWRMLLDPTAFRLAPTADVTRLHASDLACIERLYADGQAAGEAPDFFFAPMLEEGVFYGVREADDLVAVAGTHLVAPGDVAAIGNVYTRRDRRGRGLAARVTSAVVAELLLLEVSIVALNVNQRNDAAIRVYERLGFATHCEFIEALAERER